MKTTFFALICLVAICAGQGPSIPAPGAGALWMQRHNSFVANTAANPSIPIIFYGDSITDWWSWQGAPVFNRYYAPLGVANYGIAADQTQHVLWRIQNGEVAGLNPRLVVLKIGTNNLASASIPEIAVGILTIIRSLRAHLPNTRILLLSVLPRNGVANFNNIVTLNSLIESYQDEEFVYYLDMFNDFTSDVWGTVDSNLFWDGLHLSEAGYQRWADLMNPLFNELIQQK
ncbi:Platelet-activating factor acetylhydrolase IB subunit beta like [Pseudolycoriella hygida]|uniref:Platelet-activating factor acetylhydrolase IB subunit beta like n=1 Tax=Pseudolycoriella hygida TaxID=35572 RepID=A0A9Q0S2T5_9DIPT|nr:Platelet-activating factor acetylhydrolase IB subunit beta like [Pseudolycoriella hygida]